MAIRRTVIPVIILAGFLATVCLSVSAQISRGVLEGVVTDPGGAMLTDVQVSVRAQATNVESTLQTNSAGYYRVVDLVPGFYHVSFSSRGFKVREISDFEVAAGKITRLDAQLTVGAVNETLTVTAGAASLETASSDFGETVERALVQDLPLAGRDLQQLVFLVPGVNNTGGPPGSNFGFDSQYGTLPDPTSVLGSNLSVNGGQAGANAWYLDGNLNLSSFAQNVVVNPIPDAVQEFQAVTNGFSAEYGRTGGGVFSVVLKSGTNAVHGNIYEFLRNDATNARNPFTPVGSKERQIRFNNFGGTLGGPVVIPKVYNGKDHTFFFLSADFTILHVFGNQLFTVPTARMRQGDFSEDPTVVNSGIFNPYSTVGPDSNGLFERTAFGTPLVPLGCNASVISGSSVPTCNFAMQIPSVIDTPLGPRPGFDSVAQYFMSSFPNPNFLDSNSNCPRSADGYRICNNYIGGVGTSQNPFNFSLKLDHQSGDKNHYFAEVLYSPGKLNNYREPWTGPTFPYATWSSQYPVDFKNTVIGLGNTHFFHPTLINEFRFSWTRQSLSTNPLHPYPDSISAQTATAKLLEPIQLPSSPIYPTPTFTVGGANFGPPAWVNMTTASEAFNILDNITKVTGKHTIKTGVVYRKDRAAYESAFPTLLAFTGGITSNPVTSQGGNAFAQFVMGAEGSNEYTFSGDGDMPYETWRYWGFYVQDEYRLTPSFTLSLGLRYDLFGSFSLRRRQRPIFCFTCANPYAAGLPGQVLYPGDPGGPDPHGALFPSNKTDIAPRINFAWTPTRDKKTVIRGGFDQFYSDGFDVLNAPGQAAINSTAWQEGNGWYGSFYPDTCGIFTGACVAFPLGDTTTNKGSLEIPPLTGQWPGYTKDPLLGYGPYTMVKPSRDPNVTMWSLGVQHEFPGKVVVEVGYVGSHGLHLPGNPTNGNLDWIHTWDRRKYKTQLNSNVALSDMVASTSTNNCYFTCPFTQAQADVLANIWGPTPLLGQLLVQHPAFGAIQTNSTFDGNTVYHGMNVRVQKNYTNGLSLVGVYTFSKKINNWATGQTASLLVDPIHYSRNNLTGGRAAYYGGRGGVGGVQDLDNRDADRAVSEDDVPQMLNISASYELPFGKKRRFLNRAGLVGTFVGGWHLSGNFNAQAGLPLSISGPCGEMSCRPNVVGDPHFRGHRSKSQRIAQWIDPAAFAPNFGNDQNFWGNGYDPNDPRAYAFGDAPIRFPNVRGPGFWNLDSSLYKDFHLSESKYLQFRWEVFNALNHQNLGVPDTQWCLPPGPDGQTDRVHVAGCSFGRITNVQTDPRAMQFSMKLFW